LLALLAACAAARLVDLGREALWEDELAERHRAAPHPQAESAPPEPPPAAPEHETELAQLPR